MPFDHHFVRNGSASCCKIANLIPVLHVRSTLETLQLLPQFCRLTFISREMVAAELSKSKMTSFWCFPLISCERAALSNAHDLSRGLPAPTGDSRFATGWRRLTCLRIRPARSSHTVVQGQGKLAFPHTCVGFRHARSSQRVTFRRPCRQREWKNLRRTSFIVSLCRSSETICSPGNLGHLLCNNSCLATPVQPLPPINRHHP